MRGLFFILILTGWNAVAQAPAALPEVKALPDNGLARTPPMGWNSWNRFGCKIDDKTVREIAAAMVSSGMKDAGYQYVNIDDCWQGTRASDGTIRSNERFPDMKALAAYVHSQGLKIGIYSSPGPKTCAGYEGSYGHEQRDAKTYAEWGFDYLKYDWCSADKVYKPAQMKAAYEKMALALRATGRPIVYSLCQYGLQKVWEWGAQAGGNLWRTTGDIEDNWKSMSRLGFELQSGLERFVEPGQWNDPDMLEIGNGGMTRTEYRTHMTLWAILAAPLLAGNDLRSMTTETKEILTQHGVIAVNQDKLGLRGYRIAKEGQTEVWAKPLVDNRWAIGMFNRSEEPQIVVAKWTDLGKHHAYYVRDVWTNKALGKQRKSWSAEVPPHGCVLLRITRAKQQGSTTTPKK